MANRAETKSKHETAVLDAALAEHNRIHGLALAVVDRPDPPDAILSDGATTTWLEVTDAFFSVDWAKDLFSYASSEAHKPMAEGGYAEPDAQLASNFCDLLLQKSGKNSYASVISAYGPGILVVGLESPWLGSGTVEAIDREWAARSRPDISSTFQYVYLGYRDNGVNHAVAWAGT
jgi:hypothetical protein